MTEYPGGYSQPAPGSPGEPYQQGYGAPPAANNGKAIASLVLGIVGLLCLGIFAGIPAVILGKKAQGEIDQSGGTQKGRGMATAGFILGIVAIVWGLIWLILVITTGSFSFTTS